MLTDDIAALAGRGVAAIVGCRDGDCRPALSRAWAVRIADDRRTVSLCIPDVSAPTVVANLRSHPEIAVTLVLPSTYQAIQLKGRAIAVAAATSEDLEQAAAHQLAFIDEVASVGLPAALGERLFSAEIDAVPTMTRITLSVESVFDQTPGPSAGARL